MKKRRKPFFVCLKSDFQQEVRLHIVSSLRGASQLAGDEAIYELVSGLLRQLRLPRNDKTEEMKKRLAPFFD